MSNHYDKDRDAYGLDKAGGYYTRHVVAMTKEGYTVSPMLAHRDYEIDSLKKLLDKHGICTKCGEIYSHEIKEPFAHCSCGTSEWYQLTPYMKLEKTIFELRLKDAKN